MLTARTGYILFEIYNNYLKIVLLQVVKRKNQSKNQSIFCKSRDCNESLGRWL